jgi:HEAT repeat protein
MAVWSAAGLMALCGGCNSAGRAGAATAGGGEPARGVSAPRQQAAAPRAVQPVLPTPAPRASTLSESELRERALGMLVDAATGQVPEQRANAMEALIPVPSRLEPAARVGLGDENLGVRTVACLAAARAGLTRVAQASRALLNDPSPMARSAAILALTRAGENISPAPLAGMLRDASPSVRAQAAYILGEIGNASALPMLRAASRDPMPRADQSVVKLMYLQMAEAMIKLGDENAIHEVRAALYPARPEDLEATALAAQILGQVRDRGSLSQLYLLITAQDPQSGRMPAEVRLAAAASLARMGQAQAASVGDEYANDQSPPLRAQAAMVLGETGRREYLGKLEAMLADPEPLVRIAVAGSILKITDQKPVETGR